MDPEELGADPERADSDLVPSDLVVSVLVASDFVVSVLVVSDPASVDFASKRAADVFERESVR